MSYGVADLHSRWESGDLVYRAKSSGAEVFRLKATGVQFASQSLYPWVFDVNAAPYNVDKTGTTDGTSGLITAINDAFAWAIANSSPFAVVQGEGITKVSSATTKGGTTKGNAQIPLPIRADTASKVTIVLQGPASADSLLHWNQTVAQVQPWTIQSTLTGLSTDSAWGPPSIIGGPAVSGSSATYGTNNAGTFNNIHLVLDNVAVVAPTDPSIIGFDARSCAELTVTTASALANGSTSAVSTVQANGFTSSFSSGLLVPQNLNNDLITIGSFSCEGFYTGCSATEHTSARSIRSIYTHDGLYVQADGNGNHSATILNLSVEASNQGIFTDGGASVPVGFFCGMLDTEGITSNHIADHNNALGGVVYWNDNNNSTLAPTVDGAANLQIIATRRARGAVTAPGVPATTVALKNPFYRDAAVNITGGTVTVIKVDGATTGLTSGTVVVPSGKSVAITYSVAPSWVWTLL